MERHFKAVLDCATDGVLIERGDRVVYINPSYARMLDYPSPTELISGTIRDIAHPEDFERLQWFGSCRAAGRSAPTRYTFRANARSGRIVTFDASISLAKVAGEVLITTIVRELCPAGRDSLRVPGTERLSSREHEILELILRGMRSKEIAFALGISEKTVFTHRSRAFRKLAVRSDREVFRLAADLRLI